MAFLNNKGLDVWKREENTTSNSFYSFSCRKCSVVSVFWHCLTVAATRNLGGEIRQAFKYLIRPCHKLYTDHERSKVTASQLDAIKKKNYTQMIPLY